MRATTRNAKTPRRQDAKRGPRAWAAGLALLLIASALSGCALPRGSRAGCPEDFPLAFRGYPAVNLDDTYELQATLWNCTGRVIPLDEPCEGRNGVTPRTVIGNETYHLAPVAVAERSLVLLPDLPCHDWPAPVREAEPGFWSENRYWWNGTYRPDGGEAVPVPPGVYVFTVQAGPYRERVEVTFPWPGRA